ncbi:MAG TPA: hypothetical protein VF618_22995 [Thermoanaerobaculia bacterium]
MFYRVIVYESDEEYHVYFSPRLLLEHIPATADADEIQVVVWRRKFAVKEAHTTHGFL